MKVSQTQLSIILARRCESLSELRRVVSAQTLSRIKHGKNVTTVTVGKISKALRVDPADIIETEG